MNRVAWLLAVLPACGGNVERGSSRDPDPAPDQAAQGGKAGAAGSPAPGDTDLGDCTLGPPETFTAPCAWVAADRCYGERAMACNCACPRSRDSQCVSGFEAGPDGHVWVSCN